MKLIGFFVGLSFFSVMNRLMLLLFFVLIYSCRLVWLVILVFLVK